MRMPRIANHGTWQTVFVKHKHIQHAFSPVGISSPILGSQRKTSLLQMRRQSYHFIRGQSYIVCGKSFSDVNLYYINNVWLSNSCEIDCWSKGYFTMYFVLPYDFWREFFG